MIRRYRELSELKQDELAAAVGVSFGAVSQWETGRTHPRRAIAMKLDQLLGAGGEIMGALGYAHPEDRTDEISLLRGLVQSQGRELTRLAGRVTKLTDAVAELRGDPKRTRRSQ